MLSVKELVDNAKDPLTETDWKKEGVNFLISSLSWVYLQILLLHENQKTAERYTGKPTFKRILLSRIDRDSAHPHVHCVAVFRNIGGTMHLDYATQCTCG